MSNPAQNIYFIMQSDANTCEYIIVYISLMYAMQELQETQKTPGES